MLRRALMLSTILRNTADAPAGGGAAAPAAPVVEPAAAAPAAAVPESPAAAPTPVPEPATEAVAEPPAGEPVAEAPKPAEPEASLLSGAERDPQDPAVAPKTEGAAEAPAVDTAAAAPVAEPVKYEFKLPEGMTVQAETMGQFTELLQAHNIAPDVGQGLLDRHIAEMQRYATSVAEDQQRVWRETVADWRTQSQNDAEIGGKGFKTSMAEVAQVRDLLFQGDELKQFNQFLDATGVGNHPLMLKAFKRISKFMNEPTAPATTINPTPQQGQKPGPKRLRGIYQDTAASRSQS